MKVPDQRLFGGTGDPIHPLPDCDLAGRGHSAYSAPARLPLLRRAGLVSLAVLLVSVPLVAQENLRNLFPLQAPIHVTDPNLSRLDLPMTVLANCAADLSDVRVLDAQGNEVAYLLDRGGPDRAVEVVRKYPLEILDVDRFRSDREDGPSIFRERYVLSVPAQVNSGEVWDLIVETGRPEYVRRIRVTAAADGSDTILVDDGSLFRLTDPLRERARMTLPRFSTDKLTVAIEGEDGVYLEPVFRLETSSSVPAREQAQVVLPIVSRQEDGDRTVIDLERPRGVDADTLLLQTTTAAFSRAVEVRDEGPGASNAIAGSDTLYRVQAAAKVEDLEISLGGVSGNQLRVVIENGDSPPLADVRFVALAQRPGLFFTLAPQGEDTPSGLLLFGGGRAYRPEYDLERLRALLRLPRRGEAARVTHELYRPAAARLGEITENPHFGGEAVLSFAMRPGSAVDPRLYTHRRVVQLDPSAEGLSRLTLTIEDLAAAQADLDDVRIVDGGNRQWAYLIERGTVRSMHRLAMEGPETERGVSVYPLSLPVTPATIDQITLQTEAEFFDREFEVLATRGDSEFSLFHGRMRRRAGERAPVSIAVDGERIESLTMKVLDGDDAPLALSSIEGRFPTAQMYVAAPAGEYVLLLGNSEDARPSYELAQVGAAVLAVNSNDAKAGALEENPAFSAGARLATGSGPQQVLLWVALVLVVGVLSFMTLKMARQQPAESASSEEARGSEGGESS